MTYPYKEAELRIPLYYYELEQEPVREEAVSKKDSNESIIVVDISEDAYNRIEL